MTGGPGGSANDALAPEVRSLKLATTLGAAGALAGLLIVLAYQCTLPAVEANRAARLDRAIHEVLSIGRYETLYLYQGALTDKLPEGVDGRALEKVYAGFGEDGRRVGFAIAGSEPGFQDVIRTLIGFDPASRTTLGLTILDSRETPGLGDKIQGEGWLAQFRSALTPLTAVKPGTSRESNPNEVDTITGATISSRTVIAAVNESVKRWAPLLEAYLAGGGR